MIDEVATLLWEWVGELDDPDPEQRAWKREHAEGMAQACAALGRPGPADLAGRTGACGDAAAAAEHLERLLDDLRPMTREPDAAERLAAQRFAEAVDALAAAGLVDAAAWSERARRREMPWLGDEELEQLAAVVEDGGVFAVHVPPATTEEEAADELEHARQEARSRTGSLRRVAVCRTPPRHEGLAVTAVVARSESAEVHFHFVGPTREPPHGFASMDEHRAAVDRLTAPALEDDAGTRYTPVTPEPASSYSGGGLMGVERPLVVTGLWRYAPAPPEAARAFTAELGGTRWRLA